MWVIDSDPRDQWEMLTGQSAQDSIGVGWLNKIHTNDRANMIDKIKEAESANTELKLTYRLASSEGYFKWRTSKILPGAQSSKVTFLGLTFATRSEIESNKYFIDGAMPIALIEILADSLINARQLAEIVKENVIAKTLDISLLEIGRKLLRKA